MDIDAANQSILITGGSGFVGTHMVRSLHRAGHSIVTVDLKEPRERLDGVDYRIGDVRDLSDLSVDGPIDCIFNFAAVHTTPGHPNHEYYETNILGALEVTRLAERTGVPEIVFTSSISVYGPGEDTKIETTAPTPESAYGYSKLMAEKIHRAWQMRDPSRRLVVARPAVVFGPGEGGNFTRMAKLLSKGIFVYPGRKDTIKACIYIEDLLDALNFARKSQVSSVTFNVAYPERYRLDQIVAALIENHFPKAKTIMVPYSMVTLAAKVLAVFDFMNFGLHPNRVTKLVRSTDVYPGWLVEHGFQFQQDLKQLLERWHEDTGGTFI